jgi:transaldolase/glucose-6-phosphate isomerase
MATALAQLGAMGQSPWYDSIGRRFIASGALQALIDRGIRGVTVNPTIFEKALAGDGEYDAAIEKLASRGTSPSAIYEHLLIEDVSAAADLFRPLHDRSAGQDGFVSIEVSPVLAHDTTGTIAEARRFISRINRPNVLVKVPATAEGIPAIRQLIGEGVKVNITLIFAIAGYEQVMEAYLAGLEQLAAGGGPLDTMASVASFFVSRVDTEVDKRLDALIASGGTEARRRELEALRGKAAVANARIAYQRFLETFASARFQALKQRGARVQRPLWASTGTKNPAYSDVKYVEELIGPDTVNTMPLATIDAFLDHGRVARTIDTHVDDAYRTMARLGDAGISVREVTDKLLTDGVQVFSDSIEQLTGIIGKKVAARRAAYTA